jgi:excisionase family DNA binding protein
MMVSKSSVPKRLQFLSIPEAAALFGLKTKSLYMLIYRHEIESVKIGRLRKISMEAIEQYVEQRTTPALVA